jgi:cytochrome c-type biogenesis protein CcsB
MPAENLSGHFGLVIIMTLIYAAAFLVSVPAAIKKNGKLARIGVVLMAAAFTVNTWVIAARWIEAGRPPFKTMYETLLFYPWCVTLVTFALIYLHRLNVLTPFATGVNVFGLAFALYRPDMEIISLPPALQSGWFVPHVVTYFVAYAALFGSFALAVLALGLPWWRKRRGADEAQAAREASEFERYAHEAAVFGIVTLTLGLVMGAVWGKVAWGDYWTWDPKENWALVTWLAYMIYLHLRLMGAEYRGRKAMWVLALAFGAVVFTYLGMSLLPTAGGSLHAYQ